MSHFVGLEFLNMATNQLISVIYEQQGVMFSYRDKLKQTPQYTDSALPGVALDTVYEDTNAARYLEDKSTKKITPNYVRCFNF